MAGQHLVHAARDRRTWVGPSDQLVLGYSRAWTAAAAGTAGVGTGLMSGTCMAVVAGWFPDKHIRAGLVVGAAACGLLPIALAAAIARAPAAPLSAVAWVTVTVTALCAPLLRDAPRRWWPSEAKSRNHTDPSTTGEIRRNR